MKKRRFLKLSPGLLGTVFCILAGLSIGIHFAATDSRARHEAVLAGQALTVSAMIDARLERIVAAVKSFSLDPILDAPAPPAEVARHVQRLTDGVGGRVVVMERDGSHQAVFDSMYPAGPSAHTATGYPLLQPFYTASEAVLAANGHAISNVALSPRMGQHTIMVLVPIMRHGQMTGAVALMLYADELKNLVRPSDVPDWQFATLIDGNNRVVDRARGEPGERTGWPLPEWMAQAMAGGTHGVMSGIGMSGVDNMMAFQRLSVVPQWRVIVGEPNAVANQVFLMPLLWVGIGGLCAGIAAGWWILAWRQRFIHDTDILRTQKARLSQLSRTMPAIQFLGHVEPDGEFRLTYIGGDFLRVTGRKWEDAGTMAQWERLRAPDTIPLRDIMKTALVNGTASHEFRLSQPDGSWRWLRSEVTRLQKHPDGSGELVGYIVNVDDTRKADQRAASAVHLASVGKITSNLANELRRPLSAARIATEILEEEMASGDTRRITARVKLIQGKIDNLIHAHDQLHRFATNRGYTTSLQAISIDEIVSRVLDAVGPVLLDDRIDAWVNIPPLGCPDVIGNPVDLEQVLTCLLLNARDAIVAKGPDAERRVGINVIPSLATGTVSIKITDNGGGIPADVMAHLFEPFVTTKKEAGCIGLDLAICNATMMRMNGAIDARNDECGAIFTIVLEMAGQAAGAEGGGRG